MMNLRLCCFFIFIVLLLPGCQSYRQATIVGEYHSRKFGRMAQAYLYYFRNTTYVVRSTLMLKPDSSYELENCGNIETGHWKIYRDSLLLFCESNRFRMDSLNINGFLGKSPDCGDGRPEVYEIEGHLLKQKAKSGRIIILNYFKKVEE